MKSLLTIKRIRVENANAIAGLTYGFPAISQFLGYTHALSRKIQNCDANQDGAVSLNGCAVICHSHQVKAQQPAGWGDYVFSLSRNPLTKEGKTPPFNEEGKMHMEVSLLIECDGYLSDDSFETLREDIIQIAPTLRLAGGLIIDIGQVKLEPIPDTVKGQRKILFSLLPGFLLLDRSSLLEKHHASLIEQDANVELIDSLLDFCSLKFKAIPRLKEDDAIADENTNADWERIPKPALGWLVPITTGYKAISPLYPPGEVANARDTETDFRFVESIYGIGEWVSPHRMNNIEDTFWRYHAEDNWYLCKNDAKLNLTYHTQGE